MAKGGELILAKKSYRKYAMKRKSRKSRVPRTLQDKIYNFSFTSKAAYITNAAASGGVAVRGNTTGSLLQTKISSTGPSATGFVDCYDFGLGIQFTLADLKNEEAFQGLFDQYRINTITMIIEDVSDSSAVGNSFPTVYARGDYDNAASPTTEQQLIGSPGFKIFKFGNKNKRSYSLSIRPKTSQTVFSASTGAPAGFQVSNSAWQDCNLPENVYYGMKLWFQNIHLCDATTTFINTGFKVSFKYNISFRGLGNAF